MAVNPIKINTRLNTGLTDPSSRGLAAYYLTKENGFQNLPGQKTKLGNISYNTGNSASGLLGKMNNFFGSDTFTGLKNVAGLGLGLAEAYMGLKNYQLNKQALGMSREQYEFEKALANRNLANQAKLINNAYDASARTAVAMAGGGLANPELAARYTQRAKDQYVNDKAV